MSDATWFSQAVVDKLAVLRRPIGVKVSETVAASGAGDLTARERDVLGHMCRGLDDAAIAAELKLARNTVRNHVAAVFRKIGVHSRGAAIVWARDRGLAETEPRKRTASRRR